MQLTHLLSLQIQGPKKGLIWHFQGSGKSWLMVFAAQKLRLQNELHAPTVVIVDDRIDLEDQITGDFTRADIPNIVSLDMYLRHAEQ